MPRELRQTFLMLCTRLHATDQWIAALSDSESSGDDNVPPRKEKSVSRAEEEPNKDEDSGSDLEPVSGDEYAIIKVIWI